MAKYDWKQLEKEYILSKCKSVSSFLKEKGINNNGTTRKHTSGWKDKKRQKEDKKATKIIEKTIEKEAERDAQKIIQVKDVADELLLKIMKAQDELNTHMTKSRKKSKTVKYDMSTHKPKTEKIEEKEEIQTFTSITDRKGLKELTSALKDLNDILTNKNNENNNNESLADAIQKAYESKKEE